MAQGLAVVLPLEISKTDGAYKTHKDIISMTEQNLKMLVLTAPGERVMSPDFGVGLRRVLFEQNNPGLIQELKNRINDQVNKYLPYVRIIDLQVINPAPASDPTAVDNSRLNISLTYIIPSANIGSNLTIPVAA
tara:strand:- start:235 stop:636 length:402 start_codon:yes stop_codon:yes gene_type:complete